MALLAIYCDAASSMNEALTSRNEGLLLFLRGAITSCFLTKKVSRKLFFVSVVFVDLPFQRRGLGHQVIKWRNEGVLLVSFTLHDTLLPLQSSLFFRDNARK